MPIESRIKEAYACWKHNSSWMCLVDAELKMDMPIVTRIEEGCACYYAECPMDVLIVSRMYGAYARCKPN
jgi:hypothetical protein